MIRIPSWPCLGADVFQVFKLLSLSGSYYYENDLTQNFFLSHPNFSCTLKHTYASNRNILRVLTFLSFRHSWHRNSSRAPPIYYTFLTYSFLSLLIRYPFITTYICFTERLNRFTHRSNNLPLLFLTTFINIVVFHGSLFVRWNSVVSSSKKNFAFSFFYIYLQLATCRV